MGIHPITIGAVVVTYNRIDKLKIALESFSRQIEKPVYMIVVDNASNDGTSEYLEKWKMIDEKYEKEVITLPENTGGSGGFYAGLRRALEKKAEWVWVSDDDAFPEENALQILKEYIDSSMYDDLSAVCTSVINCGELDLAHRSRYSLCGRDVIVKYVDKEEYDKDSFELNAFSYVGTVINCMKMKEVGVTKKDFFIWCDDTEHSLRLSKVGKIVCVPAARVIHDQSSSGLKEYQITWKNYYGIRNNCVMYQEVFGGVYARKYYFNRVKSIIIIALKAYVFKTCSKEYSKMYFDAVKDGYYKKMGPNSKYKPGWHL